MYSPIFINKYNIYDIFHNDINKLVIISPLEDNPINVKYGDVDFDLYICPHNHTYIYVSKNEVEYIKTIKLDINNEIIETNINKYPEFKDEIIMSTIVKDEDNYIKQWINFNLNIGITKFIIYDNSENNTLLDILKEYIDKKIVVLIKWKYPYILPKSGVSGQTTQQNHSIYAFKNSKYIGLFDIDEYINMQQDRNINDFFENIIKYGNIDLNTVGSFRILNKFFYNPDNLPTDGYNFLKIYTCNNVSMMGYEKNFVIPKNVSTFSVHMITIGKKMYTLSSKYIYFNHYVFLNKKDRGRNKSNLTDDTILRHIVLL